MNISLTWLLTTSIFHYAFGPVFSATSAVAMIFIVFTCKEDLYERELNREDLDAHILEKVARSLFLFAFLPVKILRDSLK
jgi:hypothetical protein